MPSIPNQMMAYVDQKVRKSTSRPAMKATAEINNEPIVFIFPRSAGDDPSTICSRGLWPAKKKVDQAANEMEAKNHNHPDQLFDTVEAFVGDCVDKHPNPKDTGGKA